MSDAELDQLLQSAAANNAARQLTGALLYTAGSFMQVLEGEPADIDAVFEVIARDARHHSLFVLERSPIDRRSFSRWSMAFRRIGPNDLAEHPAYARFVRGGFDPVALGVSPGVAGELLVRFAAGGRH